MIPQRWDVVRHADGSVGVIVTPYQRWRLSAPNSLLRVRGWAIAAGEQELGDRLGYELMHMVGRGVHGVGENWRE